LLPLSDCGRGHLRRPIGTVWRHTMAVSRPGTGLLSRASPGRAHRISRASRGQAWAKRPGLRGRCAAATGRGQGRADGSVA